MATFLVLSIQNAVRIVLAPLQDNGIAQQQAGKLQDLMGGRQRSSTAWMIATFIVIVGRSGWQFDAICDVSAGYASVWAWEWLASRRIVSG